MPKPEPSPAALQRWATLTRSLARVGAEPGAMFGMPVLKLEGKAFAGLFGDALVLKLGDPAAHASTLALEGATAFDPSGRGQPMAAWVVVPAQHFKDWGALAARAVSALAELAPARRRPPKRYRTRLH